MSEDSEEKAAYSQEDSTITQPHKIYKLVDTENLTSSYQIALVKIRRSFKKQEKSFAADEAKLSSKNSLPFKASLKSARKVPPLQTLFTQQREHLYHFPEAKDDEEEKIGGEIKGETKKTEEKATSPSAVINKEIIVEKEVLKENSEKRALLKAAREKGLIEEKIERGDLERQNGRLEGEFCRYLCDLSRDESEKILDHLIGEKIFLFRNSSEGEGCYTASGSTLGKTDHFLFKKEYEEGLLFFRSYRPKKDPLTHKVLKDPQTNRAEQLPGVALYDVKELITYYNHKHYQGYRIIFQKELKNFKRLSQHNWAATEEHKQYLTNYHRQKAEEILCRSVGLKGKGYLLRKSGSVSPSRKGGFTATGIVDGHYKHCYYKRFIERGQIRFQRLKNIASGDGDYVIVPGTIYSNFSALLRSFAAEFKGGKLLAPGFLKKFS